MYDHEQPAAMLDLMRQQNDLLAEIRDRLPPPSGDGAGQPEPPAGPQPVKLVEPEPPADVEPKRRGRPPGSGRRQLKS